MLSFHLQGLKISIFSLSKPFKESSSISSPKTFFSFPKKELSFQPYIESWFFSHQINFLFIKKSQHTVSQILFQLFFSFLYHPKSKMRQSFPIFGGSLYLMYLYNCQLLKSIERHKIEFKNQFFRIFNKPNLFYLEFPSNKLCFLLFLSLTKVFKPFKKL